LITTLVCTWLTACAGATLNYPGPRRAPSEVAIISPDVKLKIIKLDGRKVNGGSHEVLPGEHRVDVRIVFLGEESMSGLVGLRETSYANAKFVADAGQKYRISRVFKKGQVKDAPSMMFYGHDYGVVLKNSSTGEIIPDAMSEMSCGS
jgi:hypothetical protein